MTATREKTKDELGETVVIEDAPTTNGHEDLSPGKDTSEMDNDPSIRRVKFRGVLYELHELEIGEYDEIEKKATHTEQDPETGQKLEIVDQKMQQRLLLRAMLKQGMPEGGINKVPPRILFTLNGIVNSMLFTPEPDELEVERKKKAEEDTTKGNA